MPRKIVFGENAAKEFEYPQNSLVITTTTPDIYDKWLGYMGVKNYEVYERLHLTLQLKQLKRSRKALRVKTFQPLSDLVEEAQWMFANILVN